MYIFTVETNNTNLTQCQLSKDEQCEQIDHCHNISIDAAPFYSLVEEFQLFCGVSAYYATLVSTSLFIGVLIGTPVYSHLGDYFGRKPVSMFAIIIGIVMAVASG